MKMTSWVIAAGTAAALVGAAPASAAEQQAYAVGLNYATPVVAASQGDTVRFDNIDPIASHNITSDTPGLFASATITNGATALVAGADKLAPGTYQFHCTLHLWMHGVLEVSAASAPTPPPVTPPDPNNPPDPVDLLPHAAPVPLTGGEWPFYGHDLANSRDGGSAGPSVTEVPFLHPVWSVRSTNGDFTGTPVEAANTVVGASLGGSVIAVDASTGAPRWSTDVTSGQDETIDASAAIADGKVFVPISRANGPELAALSLADGSLLWKVTYDSQTGADDFGSPVVWDGKVYIGTSGSNGDPVVPLRGNVTALDADTGQQVFKAMLVPSGQNGAPVWSTPAIDTDTGTLYVGTGNAYSGTAGDQTDSIVAIDARTGDVLRHFQATAGDVFTASNIAAGTGPDYDFGASPQLLTGPGGKKLVGEGQKSGTYWAVDRASMTPAWSFTTGAGSPLGGILGSTAYDGTHIYGPDTPGGEQWALGLDGTPAWVSADGGPEHFASTSVANGVVYDADQSEVLTARDAGTGAILAKVPLGGQSFGGVAVAGGYVFAAVGTQTSSGSIVAYRADPPAAGAGGH